MFDIGWPEITVILIIALLVIGPKDLPRAMHGVGRWVRKARAVTREFQRHVDDMVRDADLEDVRELKNLGKFNKHSIAREIGKAIDPTGEIQEKTDIRAKPGPPTFAKAVGQGADPAGTAAGGDGQTGPASGAASEPATAPVAPPAAAGDGVAADRGV